MPTARPGNSRITVAVMTLDGKHSMLSTTMRTLTTPPVSISCRGAKEKARSAMQAAPLLHLVAKTLRRGGREAAVVVAAQDRTEAPAAEVEAQCLIVGDRRATHVAPANLPYAADHRMASLPVAEEVVAELAAGSSGAIPR